MADSTTHLDTISSTQSGKEVTANALFNAMSQNALFGYRRASSSGLTWGYYGGRFRNAEGEYVSISNGTVTLTGAATNYVEVNGAGTVTANSVGFTDGKMPLYSVVTSASAPSSYTDYRTGAQGHWSPTGRHVVTVAYAASLTINWALGYDIVRITLTGNLALTFTNGGDGQGMILELTQDGTGSHSVTLPGDVRYCADFPSYSASSSANAMDRLGFIRAAGGSPQTYDLVAVAKGF